MQPQSRTKPLPSSLRQRIHCLRWLLFLSPLLLYCLLSDSPLSVPSLPDPSALHSTVTTALSAASLRLGAGVGVGLGAGAGPVDPTRCPDVFLLADPARGLLPTFLLARSVLHPSDLCPAPRTLVVFVPNNDVTPHLRDTLSSFALEPSFEVQFVLHDRLCPYLEEFVHVLGTALVPRYKASPVPSPSLLVVEASQPISFDLEDALSLTNTTTTTTTAIISLFHNSSDHHSVLYFLPPATANPGRPVCPADPLPPPTLRSLLQHLASLHISSNQMSLSHLCSADLSDSDLSCIQTLKVPNSTLCSSLPAPRRTSSWEECTWMTPYVAVTRHTYPYAIGPPSRDRSSDGVVTLTSHMSPDRFERLEELTRHWDGPMSIAVHATDAQALHIWSRFNSSPNLRDRRNIALHVMTPCGSQYPANHLRNLAVLHVATEFVLVVDVDNVPTTNLRAVLTSTATHMHPSEPIIACVATFEYVPEYYFAHQDQGLKMPENKDELRVLLDSNKAQLFKEKVWIQGYGPLNRQQFMDSSEAYDITYGPRFEPYFMIRWPDKFRPLFDDSFVGWGCDKAVSQLHLARRGYQLMVVPNAFLFHMDGPIDLVSSSWGYSHDPNALKVGVQTGDQSPGADCNEYRCQKIFAAPHLVVPYGLPI